MTAILFAGSAWLVFVGACLLLAAVGLVWVAVYLTASAVRVARRTGRRPVDDPDEDTGPAVDLDESTEVLSTPAAVAPLAARLRPHDTLAEGLVLPGTWETCTPQTARRGRRMIRRHRQGVRS